VPASNNNVLGLSAVRMPVKSTVAGAPLNTFLSERTKARQGSTLFLAIVYWFMLQLSRSSAFFYCTNNLHRPAPQRKFLRSLVYPPARRFLATTAAKMSSASEYEVWVRRLYETNLFHPVKMGLDNIHTLHAALGNPMDQIPVVHVAGTNGKGSVCLKIAKTLEIQNSSNHRPLQVGLFTSPHVSSFRERMQVNGQLITEAEVVEMLPRIYEICQVQNVPATFFEITTALAFAFFGKRADCVVLEVGLGGRLDATNVLAAPALSIITSIGLEHTRILGDTIEKIALEKGGIIKRGCPVLVGPNVPLQVLKDLATEKGASAFYTCDDVLGVLPPADDYDVENSRIATAALKLLSSSKHSKALFGDDGAVSDATIAAGTSQRPPCRFEWVEYKGQKVILDVAHNPPAMEYLVKKLQANGYSGKNIRFVVGLSSDKDLHQCCQILQRIVTDVSHIHLVQAAHPRAAALERIIEYLPGATYDLDDRSVTRQIGIAMAQLLEPDDVLVVCGSVFLMAEAREVLGMDEPRDSAYISETAGSGFRYAQENFGTKEETTR
jgi:dihydrofolate synthase / folylpolyglutamate synthase